MSKATTPHGHWTTWRAPFMLAVTVLLGLMSALLGEKLVWKAIAWIALLIPLLTAVRFAWIRPRR